MTARFPIENLLVSRAKAENLHRQLYRQLRGLIEHRGLSSGTTLPSTRVLAKDLGLGRNTVIAAYEQLALEGFLNIGRGAAPKVMQLPHYIAPVRSADPAVRRMLSKRGKLMSELPFHHGKPGITAFHPGLPDADNFPFNTWSKLLNRRAKLARGELFGSYHVTGYPPLCEAIARYLTASRGVSCQAEQIIITNGAQSAFDLLARMLVDPGDAVWMEEPGYYGAGAAFLSAGAKLLPLHVDRSGWDFTPPREVPRVIFVTPSCHHPLGITMAMEQRLNLINMADKWKSWILEDDYDSEYRFQGQPIPALQGIAAASQVVFVGTFAKILFPAMRLGYMVVPMALRDRFIAALSTTGQFAPLITQAALADFISEGHLARHLRRMRRIYTERRLTFMEQFEHHLSPWMDLQKTDTGIQLVALFRNSCDDRRIATEANRRGVNVSPLSLQYRHRSKQQGLLMGFAASDERRAKTAMQELAKSLLGKSQRFTRKADVTCIDP
jgi:GntR family transcriptional regulator/MocR family aminotransferase